MTAPTSAPTSAPDDRVAAALRTIDFRVAELRADLRDARRERDEALAKLASVLAVPADVAGLVERLLAGLKKATAGPWTIEPHGDAEVLYAGRGLTSHGLNLVYLHDGDWNWTFNRQHIANCSPDNIAKLLDTLQAQAAEIARLTDPRRIVGGGLVNLSDFDDMADRAEAAEAKLREASGLLTRANTILANMARENDGALFQRWPIHHEPLRADAKNVAPLIDAFLSTMEKTDG